MLKELQDLGLSDKEARIYLASLEIGRATADQLAKHAKIVRPTTYVQIKSLMEMGLMSTYEEGKKTYFAPESPSGLIRLLEKKKEALHTDEAILSTILPLLTQQYEGAGERPVVRFFDGKEGITALRSLALEAKDKQHLVIYSFEAFASLYDAQERNAYSEERIRRGIHIKTIQSTKNLDENHDSVPLTELVQVSSDRLSIGTDMRVYDDKFSLIFFSGKPFGVLIHSKGISDAFRSIFSLFWELLHTEKGRTR